MDGVLIVDKARGMTSHDVVSRARRSMRTRAIGHAGTLDPMATGVLVLAIGEATKLVSYLTASDKAYSATLRLGIETDSLDADGLETRRLPLSDALRHALREGASSPLLSEALVAEASRTEQVPPSVSAIHVDGERAHALVRRGETLTLPARPVVVHRLKATSATDSPAELHLTIEVAKGYYVRALARDLAARLGTVGHLTALRRTRSGPFVLEGAIASDALVRTDDGAAPAAVTARLLSLGCAAKMVLPSAVLDGEAVRNARAGREVRCETLTPCEAMAWFDEANVLVAIGRVDDAHVGRVLRGMRAVPAAA